MRKEFEMTDEELKNILEACKPVRYTVMGGHVPTSPQENANKAWQALAHKRGFVWNSARPSDKGNKFFTAETNE